MNDNLLEIIKKIIAEEDETRVKQRRSVMNKKIFFLVCTLLITFTLQAQTSQNNGNTSIAMLNYLATETRLIANSTNNRLVLEETYNKLINNTNPTEIDQDTRIFLETLLDSIERFRLLDVQRERLEYIFENQKS